MATQQQLRAIRTAKQNRRACSAFRMPGGGRHHDDDGDGDPTEATDALSDEEWRAIKGNLLMLSPLECLMRQEQARLQADFDGTDADEDLPLLAVLIRYFDEGQLGQLN